MSADRNLLFGVLALQMDFIDRDQLVRAMHAWVLEKHRPLAEILVEQGGLSAEHRLLLEPLIEAHVKAHGGDPQRSLAALGSVSSVREELTRLADIDVQAGLEYLATPTGPGVTLELPAADGPRREPAGRFRILRPHATGGLGQVSVALDSELRRQVALKEIRPEHADNPAARARFLLEAEVTGQLEHPGVVPVYGLGSYPGGRPFYAMRFVQGDSLHDAIRQYHQGAPASGGQPLAFRRLLGRFVDVCNAAAYAHSKGVLHRDLKPGNVLLGPYGETLVVDWGLAKRVGSGQWTVGSTEEEVSQEPVPLLPTAHCALPTVEGQVLGTPAYMAPEQAAGAVECLGPATDVYGLGATLYHLLTGRAPIEGNVAADILPRVRKGDFPRPRQVKPEVPAALEAVCQKAMALRPEDRYASPRALGEELERWLADEPVQAYPEPLPVRLRRQARRHPAALAAVAGLLLAGLVGLALGMAAVRAEQKHTAAERDRAEENAAAAEEASHKAERQAARAGALNKFLLEDLLAEAAPEKNARSKKVTVEEVLNRAAAKVDKGFKDQPEVEADVRNAMGETYYYLGLYGQARPQLERTLALRRQWLGPDHASTLETMNALAVVLQLLGKLPEAEALDRQTLEAFRRLHGPDHVTTLTAVNNLAGLLDDLGQLAEAETLYRQNLEARRRVLGPDHPNTLTAVNNLAGILMNRGQLAEAEQLYRQNLEAFRRVRGPEHPSTLRAVHNLCTLLQDLGKRAEAETLYRQNLDACRRILGPEHPSTLNEVNSLASLLYEEGKLAEAESLLRRNLEARLRILGPEHRDTLNSVNNLANALGNQGKREEAERLLRENLEARRRVQGVSHPQTLMALNNLARLLLSIPTKRQESEQLAREALTRGRQTLPAGHPTMGDSLTLLGDVLIDTGRALEAEPLVQEALQQRRKSLPPGHPKTAQAESLLGACLTAQKKYAEAEPLLLRGYQVLTTDPGTPEAECQRARQRLVKLYEAWARPSEAAKWTAKTDQRGEPAGARTP
jgi:tRNA A-37 threonylcarbamoyl transferase component Bud32/Tfp pilus assembly protein PilF